MLFTNFQCPFHGKIIPRDKTGKPSNRDDEQAEKERLESERANEVPDWQDPKLLAELKVSESLPNFVLKIHNFLLTSSISPFSFLLDIYQESTGVDLRMPDRSKRGWRKHLPGEEKKYVGLTNIRASQNTSYNRLSKKVFEK